ncbi:ATP-binding protein [Halapricum desulfuricans]|uniref:AAA superfamily ATPase fused to HTH and RecB nuclease domains n=1 Tax=Halapricum desulfuricans TaxID=2841257 RepID=A0A897NXL2_9EURY|nr:ATP-binding protein [Halapricum desulfuricans]QSG16315.1 AAA superfamily ATPase fused to HTH and RecB nuclease domains [Halapricum desulfuricans]
MPEFVDRTEELARLRELYDSDDAELAVIFGRRRLGKTALVRESLQEYDDAVVYQAKQKTSELQLQQFIDAAAESHPGVTRIREDWDEILGYLAEQDAIIVLDEFPYLVAQDESLPSVLQAMFDHELDGSAATFVLVGSSISMMEDAALLGNSPLYGRSSVKLDIRQLPFDAAMEFFDDEYTAEEQVLMWGVFGGVPYYLEEVLPDATLAENILQTILSRHGTLHNEPDYVLRMELTEPTRYFSILEAIAGGSVSRNEIAGTTGIDYNQLSKYLNRLSRLRLVDQHVPITEQKERSKRSRYRIRDPFFRFWFHFVYGTGEEYDELGDDAYDALIEPELADFVSRSFEDLCCSALRTLYPDYTITNTGQWWYGEHEIDVVGLTAGETLIVGECKFQQAPLGYDALSNLQDHADELRWSPQDGGDRVVEYALFSRSGFNPSVEEAAAQRDDLRLFTVSDVVQALSADRS